MATTTVSAKILKRQQHPISPGLYASVRPSELNQLTMMDITKTIRCMYIKNMVSPENSDDIMGAVYSCFSLELKRVLCGSGDRPHATLVAYEKSKLRRATTSHLDHEESIVVYGYTLKWGWITDNFHYCNNPAGDPWMPGLPTAIDGNDETSASLVEALVWLLCAQYWNDLVHEMSINTFKNLTTKLNDMEGTYVTKLNTKKYILTDTHKVGWTLEDEAVKIKPLSPYPKHFAANCKGYGCWKTGDGLVATMPPQDTCHVTVPRYHSKNILVDKTAANGGDKTPPYLTFQTVTTLIFEASLTTTPFSPRPLGFTDYPPKMIRKYNHNLQKHNYNYSFNLAQFLYYAKLNTRIHYGRFLTAKVHHLAVVCGCPLLFEKHFDEATRDLSFLSKFDAINIITRDQQQNKSISSSASRSNVIHLSEDELRSTKDKTPPSKCAQPYAERFFDSDLVSFTGLVGQHNAYHDGDMELPYFVCADAHTLETTTTDFRHMFARYAKKCLSSEQQCVSEICPIYAADGEIPLYQHCVVSKRSNPFNTSTSIIDKGGNIYPKNVMPWDRVGDNTTGRLNYQWRHFILYNICPLATTLQMLGSTTNCNSIVNYASLNGITLLTKGETIRRLVKKVAMRSSVYIETSRRKQQPPNNLSKISQLTRGCTRTFALWWCTTLKKNWKELCDASFSDLVCNQKATNREENTATLTLLANRMGLVINSDVVDCSLFDPIFDYCGTAKSDKIHQRPTIERCSHLLLGVTAPVVFQLDLTSVLKQRPNEEDIEDIVYNADDSESSDDDNGGANNAVAANVATAVGDGDADEEEKDPMSFNRNDLKRNMRPVNVDCVSSHVTETARQARSFLEHRNILPIQDIIAKTPIESLHHLYWNVLDDESLTTVQSYTNRALNLDHYQQVFKTLHGSRLHGSALELGLFYIPDNYSDKAFSDLCITSRVGKDAQNNPGIMGVFKNNGGKATPDYARLCHNNYARAVTFNINQVAGMLTFYYNSVLGNSIVLPSSSSLPPLLHNKEEKSDGDDEEEIECIKRGNVSEKLGKLVLDASTPFVTGNNNNDLPSTPDYTIVAIPLFEKKRWSVHSITNILLEGPVSGFYMKTGGTAQPPVAVSTPFGVWPHLKDKETAMVYPLKCKCPLCESLYDDLVATHKHWYSIKECRTPKAESFPSHLYGVMQSELNRLNGRFPRDGEQEVSAENEWLYGDIKRTNIGRQGQRIGQSAEDAVTQSFLHHSLNEYYSPLHTTPSYYDGHTVKGCPPCQTIKTFIEWVKVKAIESKRSCVEVINEHNHTVCALHLLSLAEVSIQFMIHSQIASGALQLQQGRDHSVQSPSFRYYTIAYQNEEKIKGEDYSCNVITLTEELRLPSLLSQPRAPSNLQKALVALIVKCLSKNTVLGSFFSQYNDDPDTEYSIECNNDVRHSFITKLLNWMVTWNKFEVRSEKKRVKRNECNYICHPIHWVKHSASVPVSIPSDVLSTDWKQCRVTNANRQADVTTLADDHPSGSLTLGSLVFRTYMVLESEIQALWAACGKDVPVYQQARTTSIMLSCICSLFLSDELNLAKGTLSSGLEYEYKVLHRHCASERSKSSSNNTGDRVRSTAVSIYKPAEMEKSVNHLYDSINKAVVNWLTNGNTPQYQNSNKRMRTSSEYPSSKRQRVDGIQAYFAPINGDSTTTTNVERDIDAFVKSTETQLSLCTLTALMTHLNFYNVRQYLTESCSVTSSKCHTQWTEEEIRKEKPNKNNQKLCPFMLETLIEQPELIPVDDRSKFYNYKPTVDEIVSTKLSAIVQQFLY